MIPLEYLPRVELLIFDLDGTLVDSKIDLASSVNAARAAMGLAALSPDLIASCVGHGVRRLIERTLGPTATEEDLQRALTFFLDYYQAHLLDHTVTYPGVREALEQLHDRTLAVLTNKPVNFTRAILEGLGIGHLWVYGGNSFGQKKPDPVGVMQLMRDTECPPHQTMIVGDSDTDVITGRNAGVWTCGVTYGFGSDTLKNTPPDLLIDDLRQLASLLRGSSAPSSR